jgi:hypothetical protein
MKANTHAKADIYLFNPFSLNFKEIMKNGRDNVVKKTRFYFYHPFPIP